MSERLEQARQKFNEAMAYANGRWSEWGERAGTTADLLDELGAILNAETPAPSQTEQTTGHSDFTMPHISPEKLYHDEQSSSESLVSPQTCVPEQALRSVPQAAQTVASPTADDQWAHDKISRAQANVINLLEVKLGFDPCPAIKRSEEFLAPAWEVYEAFVNKAAYAATLEARVANWRKHYHIVSDKWTAAEKRAEKAEAENLLHRDRWLREKRRADALAVSLRDVGETLRKRQKLIHDCARRGHGMSVETCRDPGCEEVSSLLSRLSTDTKCENTPEVKHG